MQKICYKYIYLNGKNSMFGIVSALFFGLIAFDSNKYYAVALLMSPSLLFSFVVGKMCYEEDSKSTKEFLLSLPTLKKYIVLEKNIVGQICIVLGICIVNSMFFIINTMLKRTDVFFNIDTILIIAGFLIIYNTIYIFLNYKFDYSKTQFSSYVMLVLMMILFKFGNEFTEFIGSINSYSLMILVIVTSGISLFVTKNIRWNL